MIQLRLLGSADLFYSMGGDTRGVPVSPRRLALLTYLALARPRGFHRRDSLIGLLWSESPQEQARSTLRSTLYALRRLLPTDVIARRGDEELGVAKGSLKCDVLEFERALEQGDLPSALLAYRGDLLPGFFLPNAPQFQRWLEDERAYLREQARLAAYDLSCQLEATGDLPQAVTQMRRALSLDPDDETSVRRLIVLLSRQGDRAGALHAYHDLATRLKKEYDVEPAPETQALRNEISMSDSGVALATHVTRGDRNTPPASMTLLTNGLPPRPPERLPGPLEVPERSAEVLGVSAPQNGCTAVGDGEIRSIAVLPFVDLSPDRDHEYLADGISEELINALVQIEGLRVPARTSSFAFKGQRTDIRGIGRDLDVDTVLEGTVRKAGDRLRITAQLIDAVTGFHRWSGTYDREVGDIFDIQDEIANNIVRALRVRLAGGRSHARMYGHTEDAEAYRLFLEGRYFWSKRSADALRKAITCFQGALARDAKYARAYAGLADAYQALASYGYLSVDEVRQAAREAVQKALALDPSLADAHASRASMLCWDGDPVEAEREYRRAIQQNSKYVTAHHWYATFLRQRGRPVEALEQAEQALELDPLSAVVTFTTGTIYRSLRQFDRTIELCQRALALDPTYAPALYFLGCTYALDGQLNNAIASAERAVVLGEGATLYVGGLGYAQARAGQRAQALCTLQAVRRQGAGPGSHSDLALIYLGLGEIERALDCLERAYSTGRPVFREPAIDPIFDPVRSEPRFHRILSRAGLPG